MLRDIVMDALSGAEGVDLVGEVGAGGAREALWATGADFVVTGRDEARLATDLLAARPSLKVLAVIDDGRDAALYELRPHKVSLGELSAERLVAIVRAATTSAPTHWA
jgi:hypothetical protein